MFGFLKKRKLLVGLRGRGQAGEELAKDYLMKKGYKILEQNFYTRVGEIDLVAQKNNTLTFFEIKTRKNQAFGYPEEAVNFRKLNHLKKAVEIYLLKNKIIDKDIRIDVLSIELEGKGRVKEIRQIENIG